MNTTLKQTGQKWLNWASQHPKKFFIYSMVFLSVSFIGSLIQGIFFPSDNAFKIKPPILYSKSKMEQNATVNNEKELEKIVNEASYHVGVRDEVQRKSCHSLRHYYAQKLLKSGVNLYTISRLLGHSNIKTTQTYLNSLTNEEILTNVKGITLLTRLIEENKL